MPSHLTCSVVSCKNNGRNYSGNFFRFPTSSCKVQQRVKWINAVRRINPDGSLWTPKLHDRICDAHFCGRTVSNDPLNPSYAPSIFPEDYKRIRKNPKQSQQRHVRHMNRSFKKVMSNCPINDLQHSLDNACFNERSVLNAELVNNHVSEKSVDAETQVDFLSNSTINKIPTNTLVCNRLERNGICEAESQTEIFLLTSSVKFHVEKKCCSVGCNTDVTYKDGEEEKKNGFMGYESIDSDVQLVGVAGVDRDDFELLLKRAPSNSFNLKVNSSNRLLIFLMILKTGLTFSAVGVIFGVHRTTVSRIFFSFLQHLSTALSNFVYWPNKDIVQGTMPECFKRLYGNTRVIIDCTEFQIEVPRGIDRRVFTYSNYKKGFTAKALIGIIPGGLISFKSKIYGGRTSDTQITVDSGLLDLLEEGDVVLADKGFPEVQTKLNEKGKKVFVVLPPFLKNSHEFTEDETSETYNIASVRIHVERIMQRLRTFNILNKISVNLFPHIDEILSVCCALVNLQPCIIAYDEESE